MLYIVILEVMKYEQAYDTLIMTENAMNEDDAIFKANDHWRYSTDDDYEVESHAFEVGTEPKFIYQTNGG